ncbi:MAG: peptide chain release factor N(5)-glutamine methyltransferase [Acidobacteria bacterium]|nr:MAG: peptide chain release factor N(5)-glutamine methyltransferase [Acidobacteriota bacterium]
MTVTASPTSVRQGIAAAADLLDKAGIATAHNDAELIIGSVLGVGRTHLYLGGSTTLEDRHRSQIDELVSRRARREPLQHILGSVTFRRVEIAIDGRAMVPRPETELLAGAVIDHLDLERAQGTREPLAVDLCTGSGAIAAAIADEVRGVRLWAADISADALDLARQNFESLPEGRRPQLCHGDLFAPLPRALAGRVDVIVANPPYVSSSDIAGLDPEVRDHDPLVALDGGADGLGLIRRIVGEAADWLRPEGLLAMEIGESQWPIVAGLAVDAGLLVRPPGLDYLGVERFLLASRLTGDCGARLGTHRDRTEIEK